jgi:hypothetical protein
MTQLEVDLARKERRFHVVAFMADVLLGLCTGCYKVVEHDLPEKYQTLHGYWDPNADAVCVIISSPSYEPVPLGEIIPHVKPAVITVHECNASPDVVRRDTGWARP